MSWQISRAGARAHDMSLNAFARTAILWRCGGSALRDWRARAGPEPGRGGTPAAFVVAQVGTAVGASISSRFALWTAWRGLEGGGGSASNASNGVPVLPGTLGGIWLKVDVIARCNTRGACIDFFGWSRCRPFLPASSLPPPPTDFRRTSGRCLRSVMCRLGFGSSASRAAFNKTRNKGSDVVSASPI